MGIIAFIRRLFGLKKDRVKAVTSPAPPSRLPDEILPAKAPKQAVDSRPDKYITLGVDFGTHGTKVAFREVGADIGETVLIELNGAGTEGRSPAVFPSFISLKDDTIYFGKNIAGARVIENFKMKIGENNIEQYSRISFEDLTILFLTHIIKECEKRIIDNFPRRQCKILLNLGAPFSDMNEDSKTKLAYERILRLIWRIWRSDANIRNGISISGAKYIIKNVEEKPVDGEENWRWIVPEIQGAVTTYASFNHITNIADYHIVIDIGGYTTDVSIFNVGRLEGQPRASIFASGVLTNAVITYNSAKDKDAFIKELRSEITQVIRQPIHTNLIDAVKFVNFDHKLLWCLGGGARLHYLRGELLHPRKFLNGLKKLSRQGTSDLFVQVPALIPEGNHLSKEDLQSFFTIVCGLTTEYHNLIAIVTADPLPVFVAPPTWGELPYHLQDVG